MAYSGPSSQWFASPFNAAISPTSPVRSRAMSLNTSFGLALHSSSAPCSSVAKLVRSIQGTLPAPGRHGVLPHVAVCLYLYVLAIYLPGPPEVVEGFMGDDPHESFILVS